MIRVSFDKSFQEPAERVDWTGRYPGGETSLWDRAVIPRTWHRRHAGAGRGRPGRVWMLELLGGRGSTGRPGAAVRREGEARGFSGFASLSKRVGGAGTLQGPRLHPIPAGLPGGGAWGMSSKRGSPTATSIGIRIIWLVRRSLRGPSLTQNLWE